MANKPRKILHLGLRILSRFVSRRENESLYGDIEEAYQQALSNGKVRAAVWLSITILRTVFAAGCDTLFWRYIMLRNYLKVTVRNCTRYKGYSMINIIGLAVGMTCCILMLLWVEDELRWDCFHEHRESIYRVIAEQSGPTQNIFNARTPDPLAPLLRELYPEIESAVRFQGVTGWPVKVGKKIHANDDLAFADPAFFKMFTFPFVKGDPETALQDRNSIVFSESMAAKYFGENDPIGKVVYIADRPLVITAIMKDVPENSHLRFDCMFPIINMELYWHEDFEDWNRIVFYTYVQLADGSSPENVNSTISNVIRTHFTSSNIERIFLQPLKQVHLRSNYQWDLDNYKQGSATTLYIFVFTAMCILLVACFNFINLATARSGTRAKEVGMRKVVGAHKNDIIAQFYCESFLLALLSLCIALLTTFVFLPVFNELAGKDLAMQFAGRIPFVLGLLGITLFTGIIAGTYPALYLSSSQPTPILKGIFHRPRMNRVYLRKFLVIAQFIFTIVVITIAMVINQQLHFLAEKDLGFDKRGIIYFPNGLSRGGYQALRTKLQQNPHILKTTNSRPPTGKPWPQTNFDWEGKSPEMNIALYPMIVDFDYLRTFNIQLLEGRFFSREYATDGNNYVLNESAVDLLGFSSPLGKKFSYEGKEGRIIGVVKNFHQSSLHDQIEPLVLELDWEGPFIAVKLDPENIPEALEAVEDVWNTYATQSRPFSYEFLETTIDNYYAHENKSAVIFNYFSLLAILLSSLGLFGLASYVMEQRTKEIGIRKVMGASVSRITLLLSRDFAKWVLIANFIAWPMAYLFTHYWLKNFSYHIGQNIFIFLVATAIACFIALSTVLYQSMKTALTSPLTSLRYE